MANKWVNQKIFPVTNRFAMCSLCSFPIPIPLMITKYLTNHFTEKIRKYIDTNKLYQELIISSYQQKD